MSIAYHDDTALLLTRDTLDVLRGMDTRSVDCVVTSPPYYGLRNYGTPGQYGREPTADAYIARLREVFGEVRRVLATRGGSGGDDLGDGHADDDAVGESQAVS